MSDPENFDLRQFLPYLLNQAADAQSLEFGALYKRDYGMLRTEWRVLFHLGTYGEMTAREIGLRARVHKTKISRAVQKLCEKRFVSRSRDPEDRRSEILALTPAGLAAYHDLRSVALEYDAALTRQFSPEDAEKLRAMLAVLARLPGPKS